MRTFLTKAILSLFSILVLSHAAPLTAQDKFQVSPIGRIHVDGALYTPDGDGFSHGASLPEVRAGARATYGLWMARIEVGYSYGKIGMKDVYMQRFLNDKKQNYFRLGYFIPQFGIRGGGSASYKPAMIAQISESFFRTMTRKIGIGFTHFDNNCFVSATAFVGGRSLLFSSTEQAKVSVGGAVRAAWHPFAEKGKVLQIGVSTAYETGSHNRVITEDGEEEASEGFRQYSANFPTTVSKVAMLSANVTDVKGDWRISPEIVLSTNRFALESQYYYMNVPRRYGQAAYHATGCYGMLRCLAIGDKEYSYNKADGALALPSPKTLEFVAGYNYMNADANSARIDGGISNDWSITANYYINKYMMARLRYSYTEVRNSAVRPDGGENIIQARLQFVF